MQRGQALVLVMMVLSVALTVGLSIATRSTNEVKVSSAQEESARALEAAEAGLEKALGGTLQTGGYPYPTLSNQSKYVVFPTPTPGARVDEWEIPYQMVEGQVATIDLRNYSRPGNLTNPDHTRIRFCWGTNGSSIHPALEATLYYSYLGVDKVGKVILDPEGRIANAGSNPWNNGNCASVFQYGKRLTWADFGMSIVDDTPILKMLRVKLLFNGSNPEPLAVKSPSGDFGRQGYQYTSVGSAGTSTQKIMGWDLNYDLPMMFDNAIFSGGSLSK